MRLEAAVDAIHLFLSRAGDDDFEKFIEVFRDPPATTRGNGTAATAGKPLTTRARRAFLSFAVDELLNGLGRDPAPRKEHPTFMVLETPTESHGALDSRTHAGAWGLSGTENLGASIAKRRGGEVLVSIVQLLAQQKYRNGEIVEEHRYPADWAEPVTPLDQSGFTTAHP